MWVSDYYGYLEQAQNLLNAYRGGEFSYIDMKDKRQDFLDEIEFFKSQGRLN